MAFFQDGMASENRRGKALYHSLSLRGEQKLRRIDEKSSAGCGAMTCAAQYQLDDPNVEEGWAMPRFVILEHDHPVLHWDLMLETDGVLRTWRLAQPPLPTSGVIEATPLADHRLMYLDYEGPVSGNRGTVKRWDAGDYETLSESTKTTMTLKMKGQRLDAQIRLQLIHPKSWRFEC
jgi:hypothetical protein